MATRYLLGKTIHAIKALFQSPSVKEKIGFVLSCILVVILGALAVGGVVIITKYVMLPLFVNHPLMGVSVNVTIAFIFLSAYAYENVCRAKQKLELQETPDGD